MPITYDILVERARSTQTRLGQISIAVLTTQGTINPLQVSRRPGVNDVLIFRDAEGVEHIVPTAFIHAVQLGPKAAGTTIGFTVPDPDDAEQA